MPRCSRTQAPTLANTCESLDAMNRPRRSHKSICASCALQSSRATSLSRRRSVLLRRCLSEPSGSVWFCRFLRAWSWVLGVWAVWCPLLLRCPRPTGDHWSSTRPAVSYKQAPGQNQQKRARRCRRFLTTTWGRLRGPHLLVNTGGQPAQTLFSIPLPLTCATLL